MRRVLLVSNRLPITVKVAEGSIEVASSTGGVATGLRGPHARFGGCWIGWPGDTTSLTPAQAHELDRSLKQSRNIPVYLDYLEQDQYYRGFANGVLWPLFHYLLDKVPLETQEFDAYQAVNRQFADIVVRSYQPGDLIWIHDYHLMLLPGLLRERLPDARIGFFLHIPFPSSEVFRILPWRTQILEGLLGADLIGVHTLTYLRHFSSAILRILGIESHVDCLSYQGREVRLGAFPMPVDADGFARLADSEQTRVAADAIRAEAGDRKILLGIERLDYTKGLPRRLLAFERFLDNRPEWRDKVRFIQVAVPSRAGIGPYETLKRQVDEMLGHINGRFATTGSVPVHYLYRSFDQAELVAMYKAADVMVVTPLRDGMNLVAKEYCACRTDDDGVLLLSEFAGASAEMGEAIRVNPYDVEQMSAAYEQALEMPMEERRARMRALRLRVTEHNVYDWVESFLGQLGRSDDHRVEQSRGFTPARTINDIVASLRAARRLDLFLDYDGTLKPFAPLPELAMPDSELLDLLARLVSRPGTWLHILSGRRQEDLERWFGGLPIGLYAEHGLWMRPVGHEWQLLTEATNEAKGKVHEIMRQFVARVPGSLIEEKTAGLVWHYRHAEPEFASHLARELRMDLVAVLSNMPLEVLQGDKIIEVRLQGVHKGAVISRLVAENPGGTVVAMGDDRTDEDMFAALPPDSYSIHVGPQPTRARYSLAHARAARDFLRRLL